MKKSGFTHENKIRINLSYGFTETFPVDSNIVLALFKLKKKKYTKHLQRVRTPKILSEVA
jgi:hypothetical protein